ncbi:MAG: sigma-70 family RNA polymerase sigma factor [Parabacteroides sp.]|nr:sigma-70 family RNA polymerase sigma factor [Parabacteroides sp.]
MDDTTRNDIDLWNAFLRGETSAFAQVYRRFYPLLYSYGIRMGGNREQVADTIQDLFVKLILNCKHLQFTDNPKAYLLRAFRNKLFDSVQSLRPVEQVDGYKEFSPLAEEITGNLFAKDDKDLINERKLARSIASLPARQREILYLYYIKEFSHKEIALILDMNPQSCRNLLSRTLAHLRQHFFSTATPEN